MLRKLEDKEFDIYVDMMYELACDYSKSSYPTPNNGIETKESFIAYNKKALSEDNAEILLFCDEDEVLGWINYYFLKDDNYLDTDSMQASSKFDVMLSEFEQFVAEKYPTYDLWLGFSSKNTDATNYVEKHNFTLLDRAHNMILHLDKYNPIKNDELVEELIFEEYEPFSRLHDLVCPDDVYWNSERIKANFDKWKIFTYKSNGELLGSIYLRNSEIFGVDFTENVYNAKVFESLLIGMVNNFKLVGKDYINYFCNDQELEIVKKVGFNYIDEYKSYLKKGKR